MDILLLLHILYLDLLETLYRKRAAGAEVPAEIIQGIKEFGRAAGVTEEQLNRLEVVGHDGETIH